MKFLFYYHKFAQDNPSFATQGVSFKAHAEDLIVGLERHGHQVMSLPFVDASEDEKKEAYKTFQPDLVVSVEAWRAALPTVQEPKQSGMKVLPYLVSDGWVDSYYVELLNQLPLLLVPSQWVKDVFIRDGVTRTEIKVVKESCNTDLFKPAEDLEAISSWRKSHNIADDDIMIFIIGGEIHSKGGWEVIEAIKRVNNPKIKLVAKTIPENKGTAGDKEFIANSGIADRIIYINEVLPEEEVTQMMQACDIYAAPSQNEGFGRPHIEAQACGKPVITIDGSAAKENVIHGETGYIAKVARIETVAHDTRFDEFRNLMMERTFDPPIPYKFIPDIDDVAQAIQLLSNQETRLRMGEKAREYAVENFSTEKIARDFEAAIQPLVNG